MEFLLQKLSGKLSSVCLALILVTFFPLQAVASTFSNFFFFGDSLADSGNVFYALEGEITVPPFGALVPPRPYASKTFSNERVWTQYLAQLNDLSARAFLNPSIPGTNFAFGGALNQPLAQIPSPSLEEQFAFWQQATGNTADPNAVYFLQGGGNDIRIAATLDNLLATALLQNAVNSIDKIITGLIDAGATNIVVINSPDIGLTPDAVARGIDSQATTFSELYNSSLAQRLTTFDTAELNLIKVDLFTFIRSLVEDPTQFNLPSDIITDLPCILPASVCNDPDRYVFYDGIHPTNIIHSQFAQFVNQKLVSTPEPFTLLSLVFAGWFILVREKTKN